MVAQAVAGLDNDQVEAQREPGEMGAARQVADLAEREARAVHARSLSPVDGVLRQSEVTAGTPAHLDDDQRSWRPRVDGDDVQLGSPHSDMRRQDLPAEPFQMARDHRLGRIT